MDSYKGFAHIYDTLTDDVEYEKRADYLEKIITNNMDYKPELVCDLACGTGTMCNILKKRGYDMIGIDNSLDMLDVAISKTQNENNNKILYLNQDMCEFELYGTVDVIYSMLDSVNYLTEETDLDCLFKLVANYLNIGGLFVFDINTPYKYENILSDNIFTYEKDDIFYTWENNYDGEYCDFYLNFFIKNKSGSYDRITETHTQRMYTVNEISSKINSSGLSLVSIYDDLSLNTYKKNSERIIFVVKKC